MTTTDSEHLRVRVYRQPVPRFWWLQRRSYLVFVLRELSSLFVGWFVAFLLLLLYAVGRSEASYQAFLDFAANPFVIALNLVALAFVVLHAVTFLAAAPQTTVVRLRGRRVPPQALAVPLYAAWALVSGFLIWLVVLA